MNLEEVMKDYKEIILRIINIVENEDYDKIDQCINERKKILQVIKTNNFSKDHMKNLFQKHQIEELENNMYNVIEIKKEKIKTEIQLNQVKKKASNSYNQNTTKAVFLSKEI